MSDALVQSATIQNKTQAGGGFGSVPSGGIGNINSVSGVFSDGGVITFSGSGFGVHDGVIKWDDFKDAILGQPITDRTPIVGSAWTQQYGRTSNNIRIDDTHQRNGKNNVLVEWLTSTGGITTISAFGFAGVAGFRDAYISYYRYMTGEYATADLDNHKQFYLFSDQADRNPSCLSMIPAGTSSWAFYNNDSSVNPTYASRYRTNTKGRNYSNTANVWQRWEYRFKPEDDSSIEYPDANGIVRTWVDGERCIDASDYKYAAASNPSFSWVEFRLGHMAQGMVDDAKAWFDEIYIARTPKRIEIGVMPVYSDSAEAVRVIQPHTDWADDSISVKCNQGILPVTGPLYAYEIDENDECVSTIKVRS